MVRPNERRTDRPHGEQQMSRLLAALTILASLAVVPVAIAGSGPDSPTVTKGAGNALAAERAGQNSNGGVREHGAFGQAQSDFVQQINAGDTQWSNYGEFLKDWCAAAGSSQGCSAK